MLQLNRWCPETADATVPRPLLALSRIPGKISLQREKNFSMRIKFYLCRFRGWGLVGRGDSAGGAGCVGLIVEYALPGVGVYDLDASLLPRLWWLLYRGLHGGLHWHCLHGHRLQHRNIVNARQKHIAKEIKKNICRSNDFFCNS